MDMALGILVGLRLMQIQNPNIRPATKKVDVCLLTKKVAAEECCICMENMNSARIAECGHEFCSVCIVMSVRKAGRSCPVCRTDIGMIEIEDPAFACTEIYKKMAADAGL